MGPLIKTNVGPKNKSKVFIEDILENEDLQSEEIKYMKNKKIKIDNDDGDGEGDTTPSN